MNIARAEELKRKYTDKFVVVADDVPELRRFQGLTGKVKTVNMNCRALVQFDGPADIAWYDIDPAFLRIVDAPLPKKPAAEHAAKPAAPAKPAAAPAAPAGKSPLELARQQGAAKGEAPAPAGEKKLSPLELARQQGAAKKGDAPAAKPPSPAPSAAGSEGKKLSPLELARMQGAAKRGGADLSAETGEAAPVEAAPVEAAPAVDQPPAEEQEAAGVAPSAATTVQDRPATPGSTAEIIALARQQGPFKG